MDVTGGPADTGQRSSADAETPRKPRLQLPASCDPPEPGTSRRQLVWIVRLPSTSQ